MKNKSGKIIGFIFGMLGFLLIYGLFILHLIPPEDEIAPGVIVIVSVFNGFIFASIGSLIQNYFCKLDKQKSLI